MDIRSSLDGLKTLLGVTPAASPPSRPQPDKPAESSSFSSDRATLSTAGSEVAQAAIADGGLRSDKVAEIRAALDAGTYSVPPSAVAAKLVDAMLSGGK